MKRRNNRHHRLSRSRTEGKPFDGKIHGIDNVKYVNYKQHQSFHNLFPDTHPQSIVNELNDKWVDPNFIIVAIAKKDARKILKTLKQFI
jgi:hypothetical protein